MTRPMSEKVIAARELKRQIQLRCAIGTLAKQHARRIIEHQIRADGLRLHDFENRKLSMMAEEYLAAHWEELLPKARALAEEILTKRR